MGRSADTRADDPAEFRGSGFGCGFGFEAFGGSPAAPDAAGNSENEDDDGDDALAVLASLQTFIGNWVWSKELEQAIGVTQHKAMEEVKAILTEGGSRADVAATLCAVLFLKQKLAKDRSAWELMVEKAERWLEEQTGQTTASLERCLTPSGQAAGLFG
ncbi:hypothetical protein CDD83_6790 [Cordyceps sp. RAO-2017]|nr:hypothetical protein CDD83_6790 [Cordyceps sp. RAO-2017]